MEHKIKFSLRSKLMLLLIVLPVATLIAYLVLAVNLFKSDKIAYVFDSSAAMANSLAAQISSEMNTLVSSIRPILEGYSLQSSKFDRMAHSLFQKDPALDTLLVFRPDPSEQFIENAALKKNDASEVWAHVKDVLLPNLTQEAIQNGLSLRTWESSNKSWVAFALLTGKPTDPNRFLSVAVVQASALLEVFKQSKIYSTFLVEKEGRVLMASPQKAAISSFANWKFFSEIHQKNMPSGTAETESPDGNLVLASYTKVGIGNFFVFSLVQKEIALSAVRVLLFKSILFFLALISIATLVSVLAAKGLTAKLSELYVATRKISEGHFDIRVKIQSSDEIASLGLSFNKMGEEVSRLMQETAAKARMEKELETAKAVQETLFPAANGSFGSINISGFYEPASECGGDWWHYCEIKNKVFVWIGDATGHGASAALITSAAKSASAIIERLPLMSPAKVMEFMNQAVYETSKGRMLMTFFIGALDKNTGEFTYCNASHDFPFLVAKNSPLLKLEDFKPLVESNNPRLGEKIESTYAETTIQLAPGDLIFMYTDGVVELEGPNKVTWGERRFLKAFGKAISSSDSIQKSVETFHQDIQAFRQNEPLKDDVTFLICEYDRT